MGTASVVGTGPGRFGNSGRGRVEGQSERQAGSNIFPWCSRGQTSSFSPPRSGGERRHLLNFHSQPRWKVGRGSGEGGIGGSSCCVGIAATPGSSWGAWERHETSAPPAGDSRHPGVPCPQTARRCRHTEGSRDRGWGEAAGRCRQRFGSIRMAAGSCLLGAQHPGLDPAPTSLLAQPEEQKQRQPNLGFWESATPSVFPSPSLDAQR